MKHTYKTFAVSKPEFYSKPDSENLPVIVDSDDLKTYKKSGWMVIGHAETVVTFLDEKEIAGQQLDALKAELQSTRAENQKRENAILDQISKLQALTYVEAA